MLDTITAYYDSSESIANFIILAYFVGFVAGMWKMFEKADRPGWAAVIPYYNIYKMSEITMGNGWLALALFAGIIPLIGEIIAIGFLIYLAVQTAKAYGKPSMWAVGLIFLPPVFLCILGFGDAVYQGPQDVKLADPTQPEEKTYAKTVSYKTTRNEPDPETVEFEVDETAE